LARRAARWPCDRHIHNAGTPEYERVVAYSPVRSQSHRRLPRLQPQRNPSIGISPEAIATISAFPESWLLRAERDDDQANAILSRSLRRAVGSRILQHLGFVSSADRQVAGKQGEDE